MVLAELAVLLLLVDVAFKDLKNLLGVVASLDVDDLKGGLHAGLADLLVFIETPLDNEEVKDLLKTA